MTMKNLCAKTRPKDAPYEIWEGTTLPGWTWRVLKKWQTNDMKPHARWFCFVTSPMCPEGELGDVYVDDIVFCARRVYRDLSAQEKLRAEPSAS